MASDGTQPGVLDRPAGPNSLPGATVYIAALPRSGSTMLANLLSVPPDRWVLVEPGLHSDRQSPALSHQINRFLAASRNTDEGASSVDVSSSRRRLLNYLSNLLPKLSAWGTKEVGTEHGEAIAFTRPHKKILMVRNPRDALLSLLEKHSQPGRSWEPAEQMMYLAECCTSLVALARDAGSDTRICRYEDFVTSLAERRALSNWLCWPLEGDVSRNLDLYRREYEAVLHHGVISANSVGRFDREANKFRADVAERFGAMFEDFNKVFGYWTD